MHRMGTVANVVRYITGQDGANHLICQGEQRFQVLEFLSGWPFMVARVLRIPEPTTRTPEIEARFLHLRGQALESVELLPQAFRIAESGTPGPVVLDIPEDVQAECIEGAWVPQPGTAPSPWLEHLCPPPASTSLAHSQFSNGWNHS